jgi:hypothetical protein
MHQDVFISGMTYARVGDEALPLNDMLFSKAIAQTFLGKLNSTYLLWTMKLSECCLKRLSTLSYFIVGQLG